MDAGPLISKLNASGAKFVVHTNIMYGKGLNGVGFYSYNQYEEFDSGTKVYRTFEPKGDCLVVTERFEPAPPIFDGPVQKPYTRKKYIGYDKITYINEIVED